MLILNFSGVVDLNIHEFIMFTVSSIGLILGIGLFGLGADIAMTPMGEHIGSGLTKMHSKSFLLISAFIMGLLVTVAEPDLSVLAKQVSNVVNKNILILIIGAGVGLFLLFAVLKTVMRKQLSAIIMFFYMVLFALDALVIINGNNDFIALSFDSGGVTTGPITVPFIMALGVGIAGTVGGRNSDENSFGLIALCSVGPILAVSTLGIFADSGINYAIADYSVSDDLFSAYLDAVLVSIKDVAIALALIVAFFIILQIVFLKLPKKKIEQIGIGIAYTFVGLVIFLSSVNVGYMPIGYKIGCEISSKTSDYVPVIIGFVIGAVAVLAEPAVHVLNKQVEEVTNGTVTKLSMTVALSVGVGISIALSMLRIIFDFNIMAYLIPGYLISLGLSLFVPGIYTAIAFDSGGVASGPLTSGFILPMAIGACYTLQGEAKIMSDAFGIVAMVAMTPLITIQILGFRSIVKKKINNKLAMKRILSSDDEQIIDFM